MFSKVSKPQIGFTGPTPGFTANMANSTPPSPHLLKMHTRTQHLHSNATDSRTPTARSALLNFLADPHIFTTLCAQLDSLPADPSSELRAHTRQIRSALEAATARSDVSFNINPIDDSFFSDLNGHPVRDADYAYCELLGPTGAYYDGGVRLGLSFQGPGLLYHGHHHIAQELYFVLRGASGWWTDTSPVWEERAHSWHLSNEQHAMKTGEEPTLYFWSWTGEDLVLDVKLSGITLPSML